MAEGGLAVRARRDEQRYATGAASRGDVVEELGDLRAALVLEGLGRHPDPGVVGQQCDDAIHVAALEGIREAVGELALPLRGWGRDAFVRRHPCLKCGARAQERAEARRRRRLERERRRLRTARLVASLVQAAVRGYAVEPAAQRRAPLEALKAAPGRHQGLLKRVLGVLQRAEHAVAVEQQLAS